MSSLWLGNTQLKRGCNAVFSADMASLWLRTCFGGTQRDDSPLSKPPASYLFGCAQSSRSPNHGHTKEMIQLLPNQPAFSSHLFGCAFLSHLLGCAFSSHLVGRALLSHLVGRDLLSHPFGRAFTSHPFGRAFTGLMLVGFGMGFGAGHLFRALQNCPHRRKAPPSTAFHCAITRKGRDH